MLEHRFKTVHLRGSHQTEFAVEYMRDLALEHYRASFSHLASTPGWEIVKQSFLKQFVPFNNSFISLMDYNDIPKVVYKNFVHENSCTKF